MSLTTVAIGQTIFTGDMYYRLAAATTDSILYYETYVFLTALCESSDDFRFQPLANQRFAIYKGSSKEDLELVTEHIVGGSVLFI